MTYTIHVGEEIKINLINRIVYEGDKTVYRVSEAWYGNEELHLEMMDLYDGHKDDIVLTRVKAEEVPVPEGEYQCSCGYRGSVGRFCPECGKEISWKDGEHNIITVIDYDTELQTEGLDFRAYDKEISALRSIGIESEADVLSAISSESTDEELSRYYDELALNNDYDAFWLAVFEYAEENLQNR